MNKSVRLLSDELKNPLKLEVALELNILDMMATRLDDFSSYLNLTLMSNMLQLLLILSYSPDALNGIAANEILINIVTNFVLNSQEFSLKASEILLQLSSNSASKLENTIESHAII